MKPAKTNGRARRRRLQLAGWKTGSVFYRYRRVDEASMREAANAILRWLEKGRRAGK